MIIKANEREIEVSSILSTTIVKNGSTYPALKILFPDKIAKEDVDALTCGSILIGETEHAGYNTLGEISVTIGKVTTAEEERDAFEAELADVKDAVNMILPVLPDESAVKVKTLFPEWAVGKVYAVGVRFIYKGDLYKVQQAHTAQDDRTPDTVASLYERIDETHAGTADDPIPYEGNMALENGKYYTQDDVIYLCNRDTVNPVHNALVELVGLYVEIV